MKLAIFGSRTLSDERVETYIQSKIEELQPDTIITSGETTGVSEIARNKARENKIRLILEFADNNKYAQGKYEHRSIEILKQADKALFIHDGMSKGTKNELVICKKMGISYEYKKIDIDEEEDLQFNELDFNWTE